MKKTLHIDEQLLREAKSPAGAKTDTETVRLGLEALIRRAAYERLRALVLRSGIPWQMLPRELGCGSGMTCWRRLRDWQAEGVRDLMHFALPELALPRTQHRLVPSDCRQLLGPRGVRRYADRSKSH